MLYLQTTYELRFWGKRILNILNHVIFPAKIQINVKVVAFPFNCDIHWVFFYYKHQSHPFSLKVLFTNAVPV